MKSYRDMLETYDRLWEQAERLAEKNLLAQNEAAPDIKELNTVVTILKRIQDARRAVQLDAIKLKESQPDAEAADNARPDAIYDEKLHRILRRLEREGDDADTYKPERTDAETV